MTETRKSIFRRPSTAGFTTNIKAFHAKYELKDVIGRGVSCVVRMCSDKKTSCDYAVKIVDLTAELNEDLNEQIRTDMAREIRILRLVSDHQRIITLHAAFESSTFVLMVFELIQRGELFDYLTEVVTVSEKRTRNMIGQLLDAVAYIHEKKIVHRDIKPENILLDENLNIRLADFGISCSVKRDDELTDVVGTTGYLAPEVVRIATAENPSSITGYGRPVDCWAIGVVMYTILSGSPPFWNQKQALMLHSIETGDYNFKNAIWGEIGDLCKDAISKLLTVEPGRRITAIKCLSHPFFSEEEQVRLPVKKRKIKKFKVAAIVIIAIIRLRKLRKVQKIVKVRLVRQDPYSVQTLRKLIDSTAFKVYRHWVQKEEHQNRALLFQSKFRRTGAQFQLVFD